MDRATVATVLYDEDCGFCRWSADRLRAWDRRGRLRFVPIQAAEADAALRGLDEPARFDSWHLVGPDERIWSAGAAVPVILGRLPGGAPLAAAAEAAPASTERLYRWVARHRGRLGRMLGTRACGVDPARSER